MVDNEGLKITDKHVFFWGGWPSNWYKAPFTIALETGDKITFSTSEQFFMYMKALTFYDISTGNAILATSNPRKAKELGRKVRGYDDDKWNELRYDYMLLANILKYMLNVELAKELLDNKYEGKTFVEASPYDKVWGIGMSMDNPDIDDESTWKGQNLLGKVITEVRNRLLGFNDGYMVL